MTLYIMYKLWSILMKRGGLQLNAGMEEFKFSEILLLKEECCGTGSYGRVCKAMVDQLVCAAKVIHPALFSGVDPSTTKTVQQFQKECDFLSAIRHPSIVQYLGTTQDTETGLPVLLMELMDESLTKFLQRTLDVGELVPYHVQVNLCHDISMALAFLHSNEIIHRDLSSNNILLIAGSRAKVTDFGMSKLIEGNATLTQCPGCLVYMPPEALRTPPTYTKKLDVFSAGVCIIQTITCRFPNPECAKRTVEDPWHGTIEIPIPERDRRRGDISHAQENNPLLGTALDCLADWEGNRPSAKDLCHRMIYYKTEQKYLESLEEATKESGLLKSLKESVSQKDEQIAHLCTEMDNKVAHMDCLEKDFKEMLKEKDYEIKRLRIELDQLRKDQLEQMTKNDLAMPNTSPCNSIPSKSSTISNGLERDFGGVSFDSKQNIVMIEGQLSVEAPSPPSWYHGSLNRVIACQRLKDNGFPGAYLVRESSSEYGALVLSFLDCERHIHHFRITRNGQKQYNIGGSIWFSSLERLIGFHTKYSSVVENHSERLDFPVPPPVPVSLPAYML